MLDYLQEWLGEERLKLRRETNHDQLMRTQGRLDVLEKLLNLSEELREYGVRLMKGEAKKVEVPHGKSLVE